MPHDEHGHVIASFRCPICDSIIKSGGWKWMCSRKNCGFTMGRKWKTDSEGYIYTPDRDYYVSARARYQLEKQGYKLHEAEGCFGVLDLTGTDPEDGTKLYKCRKCGQETWGF